MLKRGQRDAPLFEPWYSALYATGTEALAAALRAVVLASGRREVLLPGYGCPALVAGAQWAGAKPVLVDLAPERPWLDLQGVARAITADTAAIVAVDLLGIPERIAALRAIARPKGVLIVEDSAQGFHPEAMDERGDLVVLSFGRGKPIGLLGGGAVLFRDAKLGAQLPMGRPNGEVYLRRASKAALYALLRQPAVYGAIRRIPFLRLGETRFERLTTVHAAPEWLASVLPRAVEVHRSRSNGTVAAIREMVAALPAGRITDLAVACDTGTRLLRYPLLLPPGPRDQLHASLDVEGLGSSTLYPAPLPAIDGVAALVEVSGELSQAHAFSRRLLTLPVHDGVRPRHLRRLDGLLRQFVGEVGDGGRADRQPAPRAR